MMGYLFPINGETSLALSGALVTILFLQAVREKLRACTCRLDAANRRSPEDNIMKLDPPKRRNACYEDGGCFGCGVGEQWQCAVAGGASR
jgi:hypothetical protein